MSTGKMTKEKLVENRQQEIIRACEELYERMECDEINIKEIAKSTSICRSIFTIIMKPRMKSFWIF